MKRGRINARDLQPFLCIQAIKIFISEPKHPNQALPISGCLPHLAATRELAHKVAARLGQILENFRVERLLTRLAHCIARECLVGGAQLQSAAGPASRQTAASDAGNSALAEEPRSAAPPCCCSLFSPSSVSTIWLFSVPCSVCLLSAGMGRAVRAGEVAGAAVGVGVGVAEGTRALLPKLAAQLTLDVVLQRSQLAAQLLVALQ